MIFIVTLGGLVALIFWGLTDYLLGKGGKQANAYLLNFLVQCIGVVIYLPIVLWQGIPIPIGNSLYIVAAVSALFTIAFVAAIQAFSIGPFGVATPLANSYPLVTLAVGLVFLGFNIQIPELLALLIIIAGIGMLAIDRTTFDYKKFHGSVVYLAAIAALFWGIGFALVDTVIEQYTWLNFLFLLNVFMAAFGFLYYVIVHRTTPSKADIRHTYRQYALLATVLSVIGSSAFFATAEYAGSVVVPAVIASAAPLVPSFLAHVHDKEILSPYKRIGAVVVIAGLMLLNVLQ